MNIFILKLIPYNYNIQAKLDQKNENMVETGYYLQCLLFMSLKRKTTQ